MISLNKITLFFISMILLLFVLSDAAPLEGQAAGGPAPEYYGIEINGKLCGYTKILRVREQWRQKEMVKEEVNLLVLLTMLGSPVNTQIEVVSYMDPSSKKCHFVHTIIRQGDIKREVKAEVIDGIAHIFNSMGGDEVSIKLTPDIIFGDMELEFNITKDFLGSDLNETTYRILEPMDGKVRETRITRTGSEEIELAGKKYNATLITQFVPETGVKTEYWWDLENSDMLQFRVQNRRIFKADHTVADRIEMANMDENIFTRTNVSIGDIQAISYMKLEAEIAPTGVQITVPGLNVPGQTFSGTINENLISGVFEIRHVKYDGKNSPPFPNDYRKQSGLSKYLKADMMIESNDPELIRKAREITRGAKDSWEAAKKISHWVAHNISYSIPGGVTAKKTYAIKAGECGAHSCLVAAFCRAVGIPARVVWGAMYAPNFGGGFGQHGWNEIYMGEAGWIPVDSTAFEIDFIDSGHIRIGELGSTTSAFNGRSIKILDHRIGSGESPNRAEADTGRYKRYIGEYTTPKNRKFIARVESNSLVVEIPGRTKLPFNDADDQGKWICKIAPHLYLTFDELQKEHAEHMILHQKINLQRKSSPEKIGEEVPPEFHPYLGVYFLAQANLNVEIYYKSGSLMYIDPENGKTEIALKPAQAQGEWSDGKNAYSFQLSAGKVQSLEIITRDKMTYDNPAKE